MVLVDEKERNIRPSSSQQPETYSPGDGVGLASNNQVVQTGSVDGVSLRLSHGGGKGLDGGDDRSSDSKE
jgi:hypothetical protein